MATAMPMQPLETCIQTTVSCVQTDAALLEPHIALTLTIRR